MPILPKSLASVEEFAGSETRLIPIQLPWGEKQAFQGVIDLLDHESLQRRWQDRR